MLATKHEPFIPGKTRIPVSALSYGQAEIDECLESLGSGWLTMGKKVAAFERMWAEYVGTKHGIMVNSGSSANLLALSCLGLKPGDEVITPALTWATTVFPIAQVGAVPVLVDVDLETYNINPAAMRQAITAKTKAIMPVHLLGNPCDVEVPRALYMIEDACEAHGAEYAGIKVGRWGDAATFSFNFSHHISTIEGGMVVTDSDQFADTCRSLRAFGWTREMEAKGAIQQANPDIDPRFLFAHAGYNFKPTELQGAFGIHQLPRLEGNIAHRRQNAAYWNEALAPYQQWLMLPRETPGTRHVFFAYPVLVKPGAPFSRRDLQEFLEKRNVETRPIQSGNMAFQPAMRNLKYRVSGALDNATYIHDNGFWWGCHPGIGLEERMAIAEYVHEFLRGM